MTEKIDFLISPAYCCAADEHQAFGEVEDDECLRIGAILGRERR